MRISPAQTHVRIPRAMLPLMVVAYKVDSWEFGNPLDVPVFQGEISYCLGEMPSMNDKMEDIPEKRKFVVFNL